MRRIQGLEELVASKAYREGLGLPGELCETYELLAQGEYNRNYVFTHPVSGKKLVLRVNCGSQMHLEDQIGYEYKALKLLEESQRTPRPYYVDGSKAFLDHGILVMEYLPGKALDYRKNLKEAAACLADIHSLDGKAGKDFLLEAGDGLRGILKECESMLGIFLASDLPGQDKKEKLRSMLDRGWELLDQVDLKPPYLCCINTELNSTNFLMNQDGRNYLVDWEKPLWGDPAQDLGHFLAPTTTFWKTDVILTREEVEGFLQEYCKQVGDRYDLSGIRERVMTYIPITCLRGITWCAMAWVQYQEPDRLIFNESTFQKLEAYLSDDYLDLILHSYLFL